MDFYCFTCDKSWNTKPEPDAEEEARDLFYIAHFAERTKEMRVGINELTDKCDKAKRDVKELQKACSDNMTKHISRLAICPFSGELIIPCASTDCTGCGHIFPGNYNYVPGTM